MSFKAFVWAWDQPLAKDEHLIVLLALADIANESGSLFASHAYIAKHARKNERTVRRALVAMDGNVITITERPGRTDLIRLNIPDTFMVNFHREEEHEQGKRGRPRKTLAKVSENPGHGGEKPPAKESDEPKKEPEEGTKGMLVTRAPFDLWWDVYPRRVAKEAARKAWEKVPAALAADKLTLADLMERTSAYADHVIGKDPEHIAHPATWLNGKRWNDELPDRSQTDGRRERSTGGPPGGDAGTNALRDALVAGARQASAAGSPRRRWTFGGS